MPDCLSPYAVCRLQTMEYVFDTDRIAQRVALSLWFNKIYSRISILCEYAFLVRFIIGIVVLCLVIIL